MMGAKHRYNPIENEYLALVFAVQKMWHYLVGQTIHVISKVNLLRLLMMKPSSLNWQNGLYCSRNMICNFCYRKYKRSNSGWFLAEHPDLRTTRLYENLPDEVVEVYITQTSFEEQVLQLFFDGASRTGPGGNIVAGVKAVLVLP